MLKQIAFFLSLAASSSALHLTPENWDAETAGKTIFVKFYAPWCGHCKAMAADWEHLMNDFAGSATQLVAEVDCTAEGEELCSANGVEGFPALKYGDPADLQSYQGSREYAYLKEFADANLKPLCSVDNIDLCEPEKKELIEKYLKMSEEELVALVESEETKINDLQADFEEEIEKLQEKYEGFQDEMDAAVNEVKNSGLSMMKAIMKTKTAPLKGEL